MKYAFALATFVATALAVPTGTNPGTCNNNNPNYVCCNGLVGILCNVDVLGNNCAGGSYCCKAAPQKGLINIDASCIKIG
ncbi:hypothetical protein QQS21_006343 [Conoideocrella luteorostrata]|uniref:Uncharacterized protein n=1 Tax=Conoideocrella luteorostrata TaxID=1105319 RepID=A0AAJ0CQ75_9HYPO|nr:hypothetical protein QQS21_006343 [Conoideocrella luteorostrata]